jgi:hypothetical protein
LITRTIGTDSKSSVCHTTLSHPFR